MNFLDNLFGGQQRQEYEDFANRYQQGSPSEGYSDEEVVRRYHDVEGNVPDDVYQQSAEEAFARLSPQDRKEFFHFLQQRARERQATGGFPDLDKDGVDDRYQDPHELAQLTTRMRQQQPGFLEQLLGGGGGGGQGIMGAAQGFLGGGGSSQGGVMGNPIVKAALAGITAIAAKKMMQRGRAA